MERLKAGYRLARAGIARSRHRLRRLFQAANSYAQCHGGWRRSFVRGISRAPRLLYREGPAALIDKVRLYSKRPHLSACRNEIHPMLGRIRELDIYGRTSNLGRARTVCAGRPQLRSSAEEFAGLSVIILAKDGSRVPGALLDRLGLERDVFRAEGFELEILIGTGDTENAYQTRRPGTIADEVTVVTAMPNGISARNNELASWARGEILLFLDEGIILPDAPGGLLRSFQGHRSSPKNGVFGFATHRENGREVEHMGIDFLEQPLMRGLPFHLNQGSLIPPQSIPAEAACPAVTGACLMLARKLFFEVNGFDTSFEKECWGEAICLEILRLGYRNACLNIGPVTHISSEARRIGEEQWRDRSGFLRKYGGFIEILHTERAANGSVMNSFPDSMGVGA